MVKGMMMIMDYDENIGAHVSDEYDDMKQMSREGHCGGHMYLTKLYVGSALVYGRSSELGLSNLHYTSAHPFDILVTGLIPTVTPARRDHSRRCSFSPSILRQNMTISQSAMVTEQY